MWAEPYNLQRRPREVKMGGEEIWVHKGHTGQERRRETVGGCYEGG